MEQAPILTPFFVVLVLTLVVWFYMYARRIPFIQSLGLEPNEVTAGELARRSPPAVSNPSDNLKNLFELPPLFYALVLYLHFSGLADPTYLALAWVFAVFRVLHSVVHCTVNIVLLRFGLYCVASLALWVILFRAVAAYVAT